MFAGLIKIHDITGLHLNATEAIRFPGQPLYYKSNYQ